MSQICFPACTSIIISEMIWPIHDECRISCLRIWLLRSNSPWSPIISLTHENSFERRVLDRSSNKDSNSDISRYLHFNHWPSESSFATELFCKFELSVTFESRAQLLTHDKQRVTGQNYSGTSVYALNPFQILGLIPNRTYTKRILPIRNKGKII
jgi:hypothetical protein